MKKRERERGGDELWFLNLVFFFWFYFEGSILMCVALLHTSCPLIVCRALISSPILCFFLPLLSLSGHSIHVSQCLVFSLPFCFLLKVTIWLRIYTDKIWRVWNVPKKDQLEFNFPQFSWMRLLTWQSSHRRDKNKPILDQTSRSHAGFGSTYTKITPVGKKKIPHKSCHLTQCRIKPTHFWGGVFFAAVQNAIN